MKNTRFIILMSSLLGLLLPLSSCSNKLSSSEGRKIASSIVALHQAEIEAGDYSLGSKGWSCHQEDKVKSTNGSSSSENNTWIVDTAVIPNEFFLQTAISNGNSSSRKLYHVGEHYYQEIDGQGYEISSARFFGLFKGSLAKGGITFYDYETFYLEISLSSGLYYLKALAALLTLPEGNDYSQTSLPFINATPAEFSWTPISSDGENNLSFSFHRVDGQTEASSFVVSYHEDSTVQIKDGLPYSAKSTFGHRQSGFENEGEETESFSFTTPSFTVPSSLPTASYVSSPSY